MASEINPKSARSIMVQGTASHVGKSIITAAICRILRDRGVRAAPFKAQNMALNSFVTEGGGEIGVAQGLQAHAAGIAPSVDMNPILLKPAGKGSVQVIVHGRVQSAMSAAEYDEFKVRARVPVMESFARLAEKYEVVVLEGAGSPAEINLRENDIANMGIASMTDSPVVLVGDIDRGGVFASLVGTMELLAPEEQARIKAFIINKFRGDITLLQPGLGLLRDRTGIRTLGVLPFMDSLSLPDEDGVGLEGLVKSGNPLDGRGGGGKAVRIVVIRLPGISNFTDFDPLRGQKSISLEFVDLPQGLSEADMVILPGSKNTQADLMWLRARGFAAALQSYHVSGGTILGICGGYQMLGRSISDPLGMESAITSSQGLGLLDIDTTLCKDKATFNVEATPCASLMGSAQIKGFEIHMGESSPSKRPLFIITKRGRADVHMSEGAVSANGRVLGTYIHGLFHNDGLRQGLLAPFLEGKGLPPPVSTPYALVLEQNLEVLAETVSKGLDMDRLFQIIGI